MISQTAIRMNSSQQVTLDSMLFCAYTEDCSSILSEVSVVKKKDLIGFTKVHDILARKYGQVVLLLALLSCLPVSAECSQTVFLFFARFWRSFGFVTVLLYVHRNHQSY